MKVILQGERHECGLACIAMIAHAHGGRPFMPSLRERHLLNPRGTNALKLVEIASKEGITLDGYRFEDADIDRIQAGDIVHYKHGHYVIFASQKNDRVQILDPASGLRDLTRQEFIEQASGVLLAVQSVNRTRLAHDPVPSIIAIFKQLGITKADIFTPAVKILLLSLVVQGFLLTGPLYLERLIDVDLPRGQTLDLTISVTLFASVAIASAIAAYIRAKSISDLGLHVSRKAAKTLLEHLAQLPITWHWRQSPPALMTRIDSIEPLQQFITQGAIDAMIDGLLLVAMLAIMATYSPLLAAISLGMGVLCAIVRVSRYQKLKHLEEQQIEHGAHETGLAFENLQAAATLRIYGAGQRRSTEHLNALTRRYNAQRQETITHQSQRQTIGALYAIDAIVVTALAILAIQGETLTIGGLVAFLAYKAIFSLKAEALTERALEFKLIMLHVERISDIICISANKQPQRPPVTRGDVVMRNVYYRYHPEAEDILRGLTLEISAGDHVAITGATGTGKTTLAHLVIGLIKPDRGSVLVDDLSPAAGTNGAIMMMQEDRLFSGTIKDNITVGRAYDKDLFSQVVKDAGIADEIEQMPLQENTIVGMEGSDVSGGQRQRILIARALYTQPSLLIMDEATSSLDDITQAAINKVMASMTMTRIVIAHRAETIASAQTVYELRNGKLICVR